MSIRSPQVRGLPCICCVKEGIRQPSRTCEHHLNLDGKAGQKRRGDDFSIPLCEWHHQGYPKTGSNAGHMAYVYGPSLALQSKRFRETYGSDDELLAETNQKLRGFHEPD